MTRNLWTALGFVLVTAVAASADVTTARTLTTVDATGMTRLTEYSDKGEGPGGSGSPRTAEILWQFSDANSITNSVALADRNDESWVAHNLNFERLAYHQTTGDGTPIYEYDIAASNPNIVAVACAEETSLGVMLTTDAGGVSLRAFTSAGGNTPIWTYNFDPTYTSADYRSVDVSNDGSIVAALAGDPTNTHTTLLVMLNGATGAVLTQGTHATSSWATKIELTDDGSRAILTIGPEARIIDTTTLATLHSFTVSGGGGYHRISRDGTVAVAGGFNYVAWRETRSGWTQIFNRSATSNWFGNGVAVSGDNSTMFVASYNYATGYLRLNYRVIDLTDGGTQIAQSFTQGAGSFQDTVQIAHADHAGDRFAVASWGTQDNVHPEVQVFDRELALIGSVDTPGSPFDLQMSADGGTLLVGSKAVHANTFGRGSETYAVKLDTPCLGDLDGDGAVGLGDLTILLANFGTVGGATPEDGDMDGDADVDLTDLTLFLSLFGTFC